MHNPPLLLLLHPALLLSETATTTAMVCTTAISIWARIIRRPNPRLARRLELHVHFAVCQVAFAEEAGGDPAADEGDEEDDGHDDPLVVGLNPEKVSMCSERSERKEGRGED